MAADRFETPNQSTAGTNPSEVAPHLSEVPYDDTSLHEALAQEKITDAVDTGQLEEIQTGTYWSDRPPAREDATSLSIEQTTERSDNSEEASYVPLEALPERAPTTSSSKKKVAIVALSSGLILTGGATTAVVAATHGTSQEQGTQDTNPSAPAPSALASPSNIAPLETAKPTPAADSGELGTFTADAMKIPVGLSDEQFGQTLIDRLNTWFTAGATKENQDRWLASSAPEKVVAGIASDNTFTAAPALFGPEWQKNPQIVEQVKNIEDINKGFNTMWDMSHEQKISVGPEITESIEFSSVELLSASGTGRTLNVIGTIHNNAEKSSLGKTYPKISAANGQQFRVNLTTKIDKATGIEYIDTYATY